jgi:SAM-dependent methyltransferase
MSTPESAGKGSGQIVLDPASGSRMFYFDKADERVLFGDIRSESHILCDGRALEVNPDQIMDFRDLPFPDETFRVVIFDPPHLVRAGAKSWSFLKYGRLDATWQDDLTRGFAECFRVLANDGVLIFKWNEDQIPVSKILALTPHQPLIGHRSGKHNKTHWITFLKCPLTPVGSDQ